MNENKSKKSGLMASECLEKENICLRIIFVFPSLDGLG